MSIPTDTAGQSTRARSSLINPDHWRTTADGPRWLYAQPGRLRAWWRVTAFALMLAVSQPVVEAVLAPVFGMLSRAVGEPLAAYPWITLVSVLAALAVCVRAIDEAPWHAVALHRASWRVGALGAGAALGAMAIAGTFAVLWLTGTAHLEAVGASSTLAAWLVASARSTAVLAPAALWEELVFRGYLWTIVADASGVRVARWTTALLFGAAHVLNQGSNVLTTLLVVVAGFCLGAIRERTGSVGAAWAAHLAWNWCMAVVLHVPVSGAGFDAPGYRTVVTGPTWWTGGTWGLEGGVAALLVMTSALAWHARRDLFRQRSPSV